ncbi:MAG: DUF2188 domain-containing protein [Oxalobacter sp.]|nr:DUF2188 domain-containing protein [Oxalobacter sp.]
MPKSNTRKETHVVPNPNGGWDVKQSGATRASRHFDVKADAITYGRDLSKKMKTEFVPHKKDGRIQEKDSHGNDPYPPRG